jgi:protein-tyrosine-phosphatase
MSEGILKSQLERLGLQHWRIESGGLSAYPGAPATEGSIVAARRDGVDLSAHRATAFTPERARACDLILVHSGEHYHRVATWGDDLAEKTFLIKHFPNPGDPGPQAWVADPIGMEQEVYLETYRELKEDLLRIVPEIQRWAGEEPT